VSGRGGRAHCVIVRASEARGLRVSPIAGGEDVRRSDREKLAGCRRQVLRCVGLARGSKLRGAHDDGCVCRNELWKKMLCRVRSGRRGLCSADQGSAEANARRLGRRFIALPKLDKTWCCIPANVRPWHQPRGAPQRRSLPSTSLRSPYPQR
jgi:hypothetical protein